jgi:hypothetical protein
MSAPPDAPCSGPAPLDRPPRRWSTTRLAAVVEAAYIRDLTLRSPGAFSQVNDCDD